MLNSLFHTKKQVVRPKHLFLNLSTICNMSCKLCYNHLFDHKEKIMNLETAKIATNIFFKNRDLDYNGYYIMFFGGEPLLNYEIIPPYLEWFNQYYPNFKCDFHIFTNGLLLNEAKIDFLVKNNVTIFISYDNDFSSYCLSKSNSENDYNHVKSITKYALSINSDLVIPYYIIDEKKIESLKLFYSEASHIGAKKVAVTRKFFTPWNSENILKVKDISIYSKELYKFKILIFPEVESQCDNCKTTNIMIYPNGDIYDLCVVSAMSMIKENLADSSIIKYFQLGNIFANSKLILDFNKKYNIIHAGNNKGINTFCPTLNNDFSTVQYLGE